MSDKQPTVQISGYFGDPKHVTRADFINRWDEHMRELHKLGGFEHMEEIAGWRSRVAEIAGADWDELYAKQSGGDK